MAWICGQCRNLIDNHLTACSQCGAPRSPTAMSGVGETVDPLPAADYRDLTMEGHLQALALWDRIAGILLVIGGIFFLVGTSSLHSRTGDNIIGRLLESLGIFAGIAFFLFAVAYYALGHFMARYDNVARIINGVLCAIGAGLNLLSSCGNMASSRSGGGGVIGGAIGAMIVIAWSAAKLWAYFSPRSATICTDSYRELVARSSDMKPRTYSSPFFWIPLAFLGLMAGCGVCSVAMISSMR